MNNIKDCLGIIVFCLVFLAILTTIGLIFFLGLLEVARMVGIIN